MTEEPFLSGHPRSSLTGTSDAELVLVLLRLHRFVSVKSMAIGSAAQCSVSGQNTGRGSDPRNDQGSPQDAQEMLPSSAFCDKGLQSL